MSDELPKNCPWCKPHPDESYSSTICQKHFEAMLAEVRARGAKIAAMAEEIQSCKAGHPLAKDRTRWRD